MTRTRFVLIVSAIYVASFLAVFLILKSWPIQPIYQAVPMVVVGSMLLAWLGTVRVQQLALIDSDAFEIPAVFHAVMIVLMLGGAIYIRLNPPT